jgi:hypothetical protein
VRLPTPADCRGARRGTRSSVTPGPLRERPIRRSRRRQTSLRHSGTHAYHDALETPSSRLPLRSRPSSPTFASLTRRSSPIGPNRRCRSPRKSTSRTRDGPHARLRRRATAQREAPALRRRQHLRRLVLPFGARFLRFRGLGGARLGPVSVRTPPWFPMNAGLCGVPRRERKTSHLQDHLAQDGRRGSCLPCRRSTVRIPSAASGKPCICGSFRGPSRLVVLRRRAPNGHPRPIGRGSVSKQSRLQAVPDDSNH